MRMELTHGDYNVANHIPFENECFQKKNYLLKKLQNLINNNVSFVRNLVIK